MEVVPDLLARTKVPAPALVSVRLALRSPMSPPSVKVLAVTVRVALLVSVTAPVPKVRLFVPVKV